MRKSILSLVAASALLFASVSASAENLKVGVVDMQQILQKSSQIAAVNEQLIKQFKPRQDKIIASQKALQDEANKLNKDGAVMTPADRNKLQDKIIKDRADLQGAAGTFQRDVTNAQNQAMQTFMGQFNKVVAGVAKDGNFDLILQRSAVPYVKENLDVTQLILDKLNKS